MSRDFWGIQNNQKIRDSSHVSRSSSANKWLGNSARDVFGVFGSGIFWEVLFEALGIFLGLIFVPIPVTRNPEYPRLTRTPPVSLP